MVIRKKCQEISGEYKDKRPLYNEFTKKMENLIRELLNEEHFKIHSISSRTKEIDSFDAKIEREGKYYEKLTDITDLSGVRIICIFSTDVDKVADIIKNNFNVNEKYSVDKRELLDPDKFGYLSLHYIVELPEERLELREFKRFKGLMCEIQIRSMLQHAWAEISHDFGYKSVIGIPKQIRRKYAQQAGLLELADEQFVIIKKEIEEYTIKIKSRSNKDISIDNISIKNYIENSATIKNISLKIGVPEEECNSRYYQHGVNSFVSICQYFKIMTIDDLEKKIIENEEELIKFVKEFLKKRARGKKISLDCGHIIWFLGYLLSAQSENVRKIINYLEFMGIEKDDDRYDRLEGYDQMVLAENVLEIYNSIK